MKDKTIKSENMPRQAGDAALEMSQALRRLVDESVRNRSGGITEQMMGMSHQLSQIETGQQQSLYNFEHVNKRLENLLALNQLLDKAAQTNVLLGKQHFDERIIQPMARSLFAIFDLIDDALDHRQSHLRSEDLLETVRDQLLEFLGIYDICTLRHAPGERFDPKKMKPVKWEHVDENELDGCVSKSLQRGFQIGSGNILRLETVALFKHQTPEDTFVSLLNERTN